MRLIIRSSVVLPQPEEPTSTVVWWDGSTKLKSSTATVPSGNSLRHGPELDHERGLIP